VGRGGGFGRREMANAAGHTERIADIYSGHWRVSSPQRPLAGWTKRGVRVPGNALPSRTLTAKSPMNTVHAIALRAPRREIGSDRSFDLRTEAAGLNLIERLDLIVCRHKKCDHWRDIPWNSW
jgi:hypothetical protein